MYKRKIDSYLADWKKKPNHKPLVIKGCPVHILPISQCNDHIEWQAFQFPVFA